VVWVCGVCMCVWFSVFECMFACVSVGVCGVCVDVCGWCV